MQLLQLLHCRLQSPLQPKNIKLNNNLLQFDLNNYDKTKHIWYMYNALNSNVPTYIEIQNKIHI